MGNTSSRIAQRRAAKAAKRKQLLAQRHKTDAPVATSIATQARRAAAQPIHRCMVQEELFERGNGIVFLARGTPATGFTVGGFLLDTYCLGVKDSFLHAGLEERDVETMIHAIGASARLEPIAPAQARKLIGEAAAYARSIGIQPHKNFGTVEALFGDIVADAGDAVWQFGFEGKPLYIPGAEDTLAQIDRWIKALTKTLGADGFGIELPDLPEGALSDDLFYDPDEPPDPEEWLDANEGDRLSAVEAYHRQADDEPALESEEKEGAHAALHVGVENQLAADEPPAVRRALQRLVADGLDRHNAIHAIAHVLLEHMLSSLRDDRDFARSAYETALDALTAETWRTLDQRG